MTKRTCRQIGYIMLGAALAFLAYALNHPEASFPWPNAVTYGGYALYLLITLGLIFLPLK
ncbi:MAG: hypothetical protein E7436_07925 [Ruminococcaceae bacterium]|nr:hypothetical protein [Oscillospiraceae bacterium]